MAGFPEEILADDERVARHLHPHWITLIGPIVMFLLTAGVGAFLLASIPYITPEAAERPTQIVVAAFLALLLIRFVIIPVLRWRTTHYVITTHRVLLRTGILTHRGHDVPLQKINDVAFEQTLWDRIIGSGTLRIESAGEEGQQIIRDIPHSDRIQQLLNRLVEEDSDRRARDALSGGRSVTRLSTNDPESDYREGDLGLR